MGVESASRKARAAPLWQRGLGALRWRLRRTERWAQGLWGPTYSARRHGGRGTPWHARWQMSLRDWLAYHQRSVIYDRCRWMGVSALKNPLDLWICQEILSTVRPDVLVEIGSYAGGSTLFFAHLFDILGQGEVLSIDIDRSRFDLKHPRVATLTGDCSAPEVLRQVEERCRGKRALVIHDGDHSREAVRRDLELYSGFVAVGSYLIVEDGILDLFPPGDDFGWLAEGPLPAIADFLVAHPEFEVDAACERYLATYNPNGFLRRVR